MSNESDYISSAHSPVQWHSNISKWWALDAYSTVTTQELNKKHKFMVHVLTPTSVHGLTSHYTIMVHILGYTH